MADNKHDKVQPEQDYEALRNRYLNEPHLCPFCDSGDLHSGSFESGVVDGCTQSITCGECGEAWVDVMSLVGVVFDGEPE